MIQKKEEATAKTPNTAARRRAPRPTRHSAGTGYAAQAAALSPRKKGRGQPHDLGSLQTPNEAVIAQTSDAPLPRRLEGDLPSFAKYNAAFGVFSIPMKHFWAAAARTADLETAGASVTPPEGKRARKFQRPYTTSRYGTTQTQDMYSDWADAQGEMEMDMRDHLANRLLLDAAHAHVAHARTRLRMHATSTEITENKDKLKAIRGAADTLATIGNYIYMGRKWATQPPEVSQSGVTLSDVAIVAMGSADEYFAATRKLARLNEKLAFLADQELTQDIDAAHKGVTGWKMKAGNADADKRRRQLQVRSRNKAADFAKLRTSDLDQADATLMAQAVMEADFYARTAQEYADLCVPHRDAVVGQLYQKEPLLRGRLSEEEMPWDLRPALFALHGHVARFDTQRRELSAAIPGLEKLRAQWVKFLDESAGRSF